LKISVIKLLSKVSENLSLLKEKIKNIDQKNYCEFREIINDCQSDMAKFCDCAPINLISGNIKTIFDNHDHPSFNESKKLFDILIIKPSDYSDYGGDVIRWENDSESYPDCSIGCKHFIELKGNLRNDWGVCGNKNSDRHGLLTWEHQSGYKCFEET
jgi:hypothetical protein